MNFPKCSRCWGLAAALALVCFMVNGPRSLNNGLQQLSSGIAHVMAIGIEAALEAQVDQRLDSGQALLNQVPLTWQQLSFGHRMALVWGLRVFGPFFLLLLVALMKALFGAKAGRRQSSRGDTVGVSGG